VTVDAGSQSFVPAQGGAVCGANGGAAADRSILARLDVSLGLLVEMLAAALVAADITILFSGVISRYLFDRPLLWSDELASTLFLWLAMLGAVIAFRRDEHMRMTACVAAFGTRLRTMADGFAAIASLAFLLLIAWPAYQYAREQLPITTSALEITDAWRAAALPTGVALMIVFAVLRLAWGRSVKSLSLSLILPLGLVAALVALFWLGKPVFAQLGNFNLLIFFVGVVAATVFAGVPIAFAFGLAIFGYLALATHTPMTVLVGRMDEGMSHLILLAVPLFVFLGLLIEMTGMARAMVAFLANLLGHVRGGLHFVLVAGMYLVSGISGSKAADMAAVAPVLFPEMKARGAKPGDLVALLAATGAQTETIPPSLVLITIGSVTGVSIAALFTGGLLPAVVLAFLLCFVIRCRYRNEDLGDVSRATKLEIVRSFVVALPAIALPFLIRAAVVEGVATATEVSTIGIAYSAVAGLVFYRRFDWAALRPMLVSTACLSGAILLIIGTATAMAWGLTQSGFSRTLAAAMTGLPGGGASFMAASILAFVVLGSVLEGIPAIVLFGPLLFPIAKMVGIHEVHYAMVVILAMGIGLFAPPFGVGYYAACAIGRVEPAAGMRPICGYLLALVIGTVIVAAVPWISIGFLR
jgi:tripartite ATP-independent transporter DctM subunit